MPALTTGELAAKLDAALEGDPKAIVHGVADLRGTSIRERVEKLIAVSHPKFREQLTKEAYEIGLVYKKQV